jgi:site-specific recombinase XerD
MYYMKIEIEKYIDWKATYAKRASINYKIWLDLFIKVCGDRKIVEYTVTDTVKYNKWLETRYAPCSVQYATIVLKNFFMYYKMLDVPCISPNLIRLPRIRIAKSHRAVTESEYEKIIAQIPKDDFRTTRDSLMIQLLWDTGIRISELCDLDITPRIIVWSNETHALLMIYLKNRNGLNHTRTTALFVGFSNNKSWNERINVRTVQRTIKHYAANAGLLEKITPHSFRHGWAHKRRELNAPLAFIQRGLGHVSPVTTFIYQQYNDKEFEANAQNYLQAAV